ncbi:MAG TPA: hypothetical protein P5277_03530 [Candidatus Paceibacterota bacterium]|nr:hypothetical protein [Candidatus Paceibacterota bacterium]
MNKQYETELESILSQGLGLNNSYNPDSLFDMTIELSVYLSSNAENLTLSQYKQIRHIVDNYYKPLISNAVKTNNLDYFLVDRVGRLFTGYIRDQHYRLLSMDKSERNKPLKSQDVRIKPLNFVQEGYNQMARLEWEKNDKLVYEFERKSYGYENCDKARSYKFLPKTEEELESSINLKALNWFNVSSLSRIKNKIFNPFKIKFESVLTKTYV